MRLTRAKDRLRHILSKRGITASAISILASGALRAATPELPSAFTDTTASAATAAVNSSWDSFATESLLTWKNGLMIVGSLGAIAIASLILGQQSEEVESTPTAIDISTLVQPLSPSPQLVENRVDPFDWVQHSSKITDPRYQKLLNFIRETPEEIDSLRNDLGESLLITATRYGNAVGVFLLLWHGADPNLTDHSGKTALMYAVKNRGQGGDGLRDMLLYKGADVNASNHTGDTPLILAVEANNYSHTEFLLWMGADIHPPSASFDRYPNALADSLGHDRIAQMLEVIEDSESDTVSYEESAEVPDFVQRALKQATLKADLAKLETLIAEGADINEPDERGRTILHTASTTLGLVDVATYLIFMGADVNAVDNKGFTPLTAGYGWMGFSWDRRRYLLLLAGADLSLRPENGHNAVSLGAARANGHPMQLGIWAGVDPTESTKHGTPMHIASKAGHQRIVAQLIQNGVDEAPYISDDPAWKMHTTARSGDLDKLGQLIASGVSPDIPDAQGNSPMINAIQNRQIDAARMLLAAGADPNFINENSKMTALMRTVFWRFWAVHNFREELLQAGADPNIPDKNGRTPIIRACMRGDGLMNQQISQLVLYGADLSHRDKHGNTALHYAKQRPKDTVATYLMELGAEL